MHCTATRMQGRPLPGVSLAIVRRGEPSLFRSYGVAHLDEVRAWVYDSRHES